MKIEQVKLGSLHPDPRNARTHDRANIDSIKRSLTAHGQQKPIVVAAGGTIIAGNGTWQAAQELGWKTIAIVRTALKGPQALSYAVMDNRTAELAGWNGRELKALIDELKGTDASIEDMFPAPDLRKILAESERQEAKKPEEDAVPPPPAHAVSRRGQVWALGLHRLMCGDSTQPADTDRLMAGKKADLIFTDPPYGVSIGDKNKMLNTFQRAGRCLENIESDTKTPDELYVLLKAAFTNTRRHMKDCCAVYVCSPQGGGLGMMMMMMMMMMMKDSGLEIRHVLNWVKNSPTFSLGRLDYDYQHEPILFTWGKSHKKIMAGEHRTSCWFIDKPRESKLHPTMKPVAVPLNAILNSSERGDIVLDIFGGAGSTLMAAEQSGRSCYCMEIDPLYADVIVKRWENQTGKKAVLESGHGPERTRRRGNK